MPIPLFHVDAFTDKPFAGNPAAVALLDAPRDPSWMQHVAAEMNLSETAFIEPRRTDSPPRPNQPPEDEPAAFNLRWFTPTTEVDLCGHATLASAHTLWQTRRVPTDSPIVFHTRSGPLTCRPTTHGIQLDFPADPPHPIDPPPKLVAALGAEPDQVLAARFDLLCLFPDADAVRNLRPDFRALAALDARGVTVTAPSDAPPFDFISRFFAPASGIDEDPVTGSAHCKLAPFWAQRLDRTELIALQASPRTGVVRCQLRDDRVLLTGRAVTVLSAELLV